MTKYLILRVNQLTNIAREIGVIFILVAIGMIVLVFSIINYQLQKLSIPYINYYLLVSNILILIYIRISRNDLRFLSITSINIYGIQIFDYGIISMPFVVIYICNEWYTNLIFLAITIVCIPYYFIKSNNSYLNRFKRLLPTWVKWYNYEWISGMRTFKLTFPLIIILAIAFAWHEYFTILVLSFYILLLPAFYKNFEPSIFLECQHLKSAKLIITKSLRHIQINLVIFCSSIPYLLLNTEHYYLILVLVISSIFIIFWLNIVKYYYYNPNSTSFKGDITSNLITGCIFPFPFLLPIAILFMIILYPQSINNLKNYLDD